MTKLTDFRSDDALWSFETARFVVEFHASEEDMAPEDSFEQADDIEFARSGDPAAWFCAWVLVRAKRTTEDYRYSGDREGEVIGYDTLGGCSYRSFKDFVGERTGWKPGARIVPHHYFPGMVREAVNAARATLKHQAARALHARGAV